MKGFITELIKFLIPCLLLMVIFELMLRIIPNDYRNKSAFLDENSDSIEVLILGNSHSENGLNPEYLTKCSFNAAFPAQSLDYDYEILKKYEHKWSNLEYIILPISYGSFFEKLESTTEKWRITEYTLHFKLRTNKHLKYRSEMLSNRFNVNITRLFNYYILRKDNVKCTRSGWNVTYSSSSKSNKTLMETGLINAKSYTAKSLQYFDEMASALRSIVDFGERHSFQVILFTPPAFETYRENLNQEQISKTIKTATIISQKYEYCDYYNMLDDSLLISTIFSMQII